MARRMAARLLAFVAFVGVAFVDEAFLAFVDVAFVHVAFVAFVEVEVEVAFVAFVEVAFGAVRGVRGVRGRSRLWLFSERRLLLPPTPKQRAPCAACVSRACMPRACLSRCLSRACVHGPISPGAVKWGQRACRRP